MRFAACKKNQIKRNLAVYAYYEFWNGLLILNKPV